MSASLKSLLICLGLFLCLLPTATALAAEDGGHHVHVGADENTNEDLSEFNSDLSIYTFLVFIGLMLLLWRFAFGPISKALHDREDSIRKNIEDAKTERIKAEELRGEYEGMLEAAADKVRGIYAEANAQAEEMRTKRVAEADQEAQTRIQQAIQEIERAKERAISELFELENQRIVQATEHVLGRALSDDDQHRLVNEALAHFSNN